MQKKEDTILLTRQCLSYSFSVASVLRGYSTGVSTMASTTGIITSGLPTVTTLTPFLKSAMKLTGFRPSDMTTVRCSFLPMCVKGVPVVFFTGTQVAGFQCLTPCRVLSRSEGIGRKWVIVRALWFSAE